VRKEALFIGALAVFIAPIAVRAALVDPALIPDGEYKVTIEKVVDSKHIIVKMDNGIESEVPATKTLSFDGASAAKTARLFIYKGVVITFRAG
jgi:hypothetical protein